MKPEPIVRHLDETEQIPCPFGNARRVITGGEGGISNVHVISVTQGNKHYHAAYDEVFYVLSGKGNITLNEKSFSIRPGSVAVIPRGTIHSIRSESNDLLEFIIFGTPPMFIEDERAKPLKP